MQETERKKQYRTIDTCVYKGRIKLQYVYWTNYL